MAKEFYWGMYSATAPDNYRLFKGRTEVDPKPAYDISYSLSYDNATSNYLYKRVKGFYEHAGELYFVEYDWPRTVHSNPTQQVPADPFSETKLTRVSDGTVHQVSAASYTPSQSSVVGQWNWSYWGAKSGDNYGPVLNRSRRPNLVGAHYITEHKFVLVDVFNPHLSYTYDIGKLTGNPYVNVLSFATANEVLVLFAVEFVDENDGSGSEAVYIFHPDGREPTVLGGVDKPDELGYFSFSTAIASVAADVDGTTSVVHIDTNWYSATPMTSYIVDGDANVVQVGVTPDNLQMTNWGIGDASSPYMLGGNLTLVAGTQVDASTQYPALYDASTGSVVGENITSNGGTYSLGDLWEFLAVDLAGNHLRTDWNWASSTSGARSVHGWDVLTGEEWGSGLPAVDVHPSDTSGVEILMPLSCTERLFLPYGLGRPAGSPAFTAYENTAETEAPESLIDGEQAVY